MTNALKIATISVAAMVIFAGCAKPPENTLAEAQEALEQAKLAGANQFAKQEYASAQEIFDQALASINSEKRKLAFNRNYSNAARLLSHAEELADKAAESAKAEFARIRAEQAKAQSKKIKKKSGKQTAITNSKKR
jgi:VIT1/CCC1 family predicted Fe2+/Mn2+ transporter